MQEIFEKIIEKLEELNLGGISMKEDGKYWLIRKVDAIEIVKQAAAEYVPDNNVGEWIPCSVRLPEESLGSVIGWDASRERCVFVQYLQGRWELNDFESVNITHWMNVPHQPKGE